MGLVLAIVSCVLLALVAGLLLLLGQLLRGMRREMREAPLLAEKLAQQLMAVRSGLEQAKHEIHAAAQKLGPDLNVHLQAAQTTVQDLKFLIARGEQVATKLEGGGRSPAAVAPATMAKVDVALPEISGAPQAISDPLESLLADLEDAAGTQPAAQSGGQPVRRRPSQAEVELRAKERNS